MAVKIKDIPVYERPQERLILSGVESLSNEELIAIILKTGTRGASVKDLSAELLSKVGNIKKLNDINYEFLKKFKGIGKGKACYLLSAIELGKRINREVDTLKEKLGNKKQEYFYCIYLDNSKKIINDKLLFIGTINYSIVHPREVFKEAYLSGASGIICVHNHPGENPKPSNEDINITKILVEAGKILGIKVLDHIIVCKNNYHSFLENDDIIF